MGERGWICADLQYVMIDLVCHLQDVLEVGDQRHHGITTSH